MDQISAANPVRDDLSIEDDAAKMLDSFRRHLVPRRTPLAGTEVTPNGVQTMAHDPSIDRSSLRDWRSEV